MPENINKKALGIDFGLKRIGLSLSDDTQTIAFPFKYIINESLKKAVSELKEILDKENFIDLIYIYIYITDLHFLQSSE